jgi:hypothetical protein
MMPIDPMMGEFRAHYAGFFDPGFGYAAEGVGGSRAVLEVRSYDVPFILEDGQAIARLMYEELSEVPDRSYGGDIGSNYQNQGLKLSKHFKQRASSNTASEFQTAKKSGARQDLSGDTKKSRAKRKPNQSRVGKSQAARQKESAPTTRPRA